MALELQRKTNNTPAYRAPTAPATTATTSTSTSPGARPTTADRGAPAAPASADGPSARPTLDTSLDSRRRFAADSGTAHRAFNLNRQIDSATTARDGGRGGRGGVGGTGGTAGTDTPPAAPAAKPAEDAIAVLDRDFEAFDTANEGGDPDGNVSQDDLRAVADNRGGSFTAEQQQAARTLLESTAYRSFLDTGAGRGRVDGNISREDVDGAVASIASGDYYDELLDTAAGRGSRDGNVSQDDLDAALSDPSIPEETKDALRLLALSSDGTEDLHGALEGFNADEVAAVSALYRSPEFTALSEEDRVLAADAIRDSGAAPETIDEIKTLISSEEFRSGTAEEKTAALGQVALYASPEFKALPEADQNLIRETLEKADPADTEIAGALNHLINDPNFTGLSAEEKTSILSQARNYPDSRSVTNLDRMIDKDWFQDQSTEDKQRSAKLVAHLSQHDDGDREVIDGTLERFLGEDSDYRLEWKDIPAEGGNITYGYADDETLTLNSNLVGANNDPVALGDETHVIENTTAHEVSHLVNGDSVDDTFEYLNEEYRAWYVGYQAEHGHPPTNEESVARWEYFLNPDGGYADSAQDALDNDEEAEQIYGLLSELTGVEVNADNYADVIADPSGWSTDPNGYASDNVFPDSDDLDN